MDALLHLEHEEHRQRRIIEYFSNARMTELPSFRALCNALKAICIDVVVRAERERGVPRAHVLDVGCGRGGDLNKWIKPRLRSYVGLDGSARCVEEARRRHTSLVANGRSNLTATFEVVDLCRDPMPVATSSIDIVSAMFFLQFIFESQHAAGFFFDECRRALKPGGIFMAILPDGDRVHSLLTRQVCIEHPTVTFGHFRLEPVAGDIERGAYGIAYNFSLTHDGGCVEYVASPELLALLLRERDFEPILPGGFTCPAQQFFCSSGQLELAASVMKGEPCSHIDWLSLGFFTVLLAALPAEQAPGDAARKSPPAEDSAPRGSRGS